MKENVYATKVEVCDDLINRIQLTAADIVAGQWFFVRGSILCHSELRFEAMGGHFGQLLWSCTLHSVRWQVLTARRERTQKGVLWSDEWKMLQGTEFDFFRYKKGINCNFMLKRFFSHFVKLCLSIPLTVWPSLCVYLSLNLCVCISLLFLSIYRIIQSSSTKRNVSSHLPPFRSYASICTS
jgi:hypothetical protein